MKQEFPITNLHGHALQVQPISDGTARLTVDGAFVTDRVFCDITSVPQETFDLFFRRCAGGKGSPVAFANPVQAAICVVSLAGYMCAQAREKQSMQGGSYHV